MAFKRHHIQPDSPTNVFATLNLLDGQYQSYFDIFDGNLKFTNSSAANTIDFSNYLVSSIFFGMDTSFYFEVNMPDKGDSSGNFFGIFQKETIDSSLQYGRIQATSGNHNAVYQWANGGIVRINSSGATTYSVSSPTTSTVIGAFYNASDRTFSYYHDGILHQSVDISMFNDTYALRPVFSSYYGEVRINFGQDHTFAGNKTDSNGPYTDANGQGQFYCQPPAGALALCTENLPVTPITAHLDEKPGDYFKAVTWQNSSGDVSVPLGFEADLIWVKSVDIAYSHRIQDSCRGWHEYMNTNSRDASKAVDPGYTAKDVNSEGFTFNGTFNSDTQSAKMVAWCWKGGGSAGNFNIDGKAYNSAAEAGLDGSITVNKASVNTKAGFGIYQYSGSSGKLDKIRHGLNQAPKFMIVKNKTTNSRPFIGLYTDDSQAYDCYMEGSFVNQNMFQAEVDSTSVGFNGGSAGQYGNHAFTNESGKEYVLYAWHPVPGYSAIGTYKNNGSSDGPFIYTGFKPAFVMIKNVSKNANWIIHDSARNPHNPSTDHLRASTSGATDSGADETIDLLSNGWKSRGTSSSSWGNVNSSSSEDNTFIYLAFAEKPETPASRVTITKPDLKANDMRSMYFDGSSNYLSRTSQGGDRRIWTWSSWIKMERPLSGNRTLFHQYDGSAGNRCVMNFSGNTFQANSGGSGGQINKIITNDKFKDYTGWHHFHVANDTTQAEATQRIRLWVDGIEIHDTKTPADQNTEGLGNSSNTMEIGHLAGGWFPGYMANIYFIDGQALEPSALTETVNGVLIPKQYEGEYGTNGFHLDFAPENMEYSGDTITRVLDESPNSNHWTAH